MIDANNGSDIPMMEDDVSKGVTDLETCIGYFTLPRRGCENLNFPVHLSGMTYS